MFEGFESGGQGLWVLEGGHFLGIAGGDQQHLGAAQNVQAEVVAVTMCRGYLAYC